MPGYVFLGNSTKPTKEEAQNRENIKLNNVSRPCLQTALDMGYEVYLGVNRDNPNELKCDELPIKLYDSHTYRSITAFRDNWIAYRNLCNLVKEKNIEVIHCNSPVGGMIGRLVGKKYHVKKVIYTAHGFHFYKGAPFFNRTILKWAEQIMAHWTDVIITINQEDYEAAKKFHLKKEGKVYLVHGVGIDLSLFNNVEKERSKKRVELEIPLDAFVLTSVGDLNKNKNHEIIIRALHKLNDKTIHYIIAGKGELYDYLLDLAKKLNVIDQIHLLGYRNDIADLYGATDICVFPSIREGLGIAAIEGMASQLPLICSQNRGSGDYAENGVNAIVCDYKSVDQFAKAIKVLKSDPDMRNSMGKMNCELAKKYDVNSVKEQIKTIYKESLL